ncbi:MAG: RES domain-containing protein [Ruminococcus sp.]|nr:RES domain-containing protein [Ruminococcus sp.]
MNEKNFSIPQIVESNDEYVEKVTAILNHYKTTIHESISTKYETILLEDVDFVCNTLLEALFLGINGKFSEMDEKNLIAYYLEDEFWISELDHSYAFRGLTYFENLHSQGYGQHYEELKDNDLTFFRAVYSKTVPNIRRMLNCPYSSLSYASAGRFSKQGASCMYLGTTSYVCAKELQFDEKSDKNLYVSAIKFNDEGKKLKVLNLASSKYWKIYDRRRDGNNIIRKQIWLSHLKLYPVIIATSFVVKNHIVNELKYEYLLSQSLMRTLKENGIDGIAYASKRDSNSDFAFPHNINLAIIVDDVSEENDYGTLKNYLSITEPVKLTQSLVDKISESNDDIKHQSYVNSNFSDPNNFNSKTHWLGDNVLYSRLPYSIFDDYLVNQQFIAGNQL